MAWIIETEDFKAAQTEDQQLAIKTCPGYDEALQWVLDHTYTERGIKSHFQKCSNFWDCKVRLYFTPFVNKLTVFDRCLMD